MQGVSSRLLPGSAAGGSDAGGPSEAFLLQLQFRIALQQQVSEGAGALPGLCPLAHSRCIQDPGTSSSGHACTLMVPENRLCSKLCCLEAPKQCKLSFLSLSCPLLKATLTSFPRYARLLQVCGMPLSIPVLNPLSSHPLTPPCSCSNPTLLLSWPTLAPALTHPRHVCRTCQSSCRWCSSWCSTPQ
jgi:hypothetical protein